MSASLATQLPYIKDSPAKTITDIAARVLIPGVSAWEGIKDIFGEEVQGIVKIKRNTGNSITDLTYKKHQDLVELIQKNDNSALKYFSLDDEWMLCIAKSNKTTTKSSDGTIQTETILEEAKIPYQTLISGYSVPFEFFITLQQLSQNAEYVSAVADLIQGGEIELTIFDTTKVIIEENTYKYKVRKRWVEEIEVPKVSYISTISSRSFDRETTVTKLATEMKKGGKNPTTTSGKGENKNPDKNEGTNTPGKGENKDPDKNEGTDTPDKGENKNPDKNETPDKNPDENDEPKTEIVKVQRDEKSEEIVETTITTQEITSITAAVTKADVWVIKQKATYKKCEDSENPKYPLGEDGITNELDSEATDEEIEKISEGEWKVERSEKLKETITQEEIQLETSELSIDESRFLGLWKSIWIGEYVPGALYAPDGFLVKYKMPNRVLTKYESPVGNILSSEDLLYNQLEKSENTQVHAQLMRYLINYYKDPTTAVKPDLSIFTTSEFRDITYSSSTVKDFLHYFEGAPKESGNQYIVFDDGFGNLTVGWGVYINKHTSRFTARGINVSNVTVGSTIDKTIVDSIEDEIIEEYRNAVIQATSGLGLQEYQIDALTSRVYNCGIGGGLKGFVQSYNQYGNTEELYENLLKNPTTSNGKVAPGLVRRRKEEWNLFHTGYYANTNSYYTELSGKYANAILEKSKQCHDYLRTNKYKYAQAGISVPITSAVKTVDCSSFVSWVLYEAGFTEFAGYQKTSSYFRKNPMNWQKISKENLQAGDILVYIGHVEIYAGDGKYYNCGGNKSIQAVAPSKMGKGINSSEFLFGLRP